MHTVYREFFASGNFGKNDAWKEYQIFTESYHRNRPFEWQKLAELTASLSRTKEEHFDLQVTTPIFILKSYSYSKPKRTLQQYSTTIEPILAASLT